MGRVADEGHYKGQHTQSRLRWMPKCLRKQGKNTLLFCRLGLVIVSTLVSASCTPTPTPVQWDDLYEKSSDVEMDVEWETYVNTLVGKKATWTCEVYNATSSGRLDLYCGDSWHGCTVSIDVPTSTLSRYHKDQRVTFSGIIERIRRPCFVSFSRVSVK